jgi:hypothetical protein
MLSKVPLGLVNSAFTISVWRGRAVTAMEAI